MQGLQPRFLLVFALAWAAAGSHAQVRLPDVDTHPLQPVSAGAALLHEGAALELNAGRFGLETARIHAPGASYVKVHFGEFDLPDGVTVEVGNVDGTEIYRYGNAGFDAFTLDRRRGDDGINRFYAMSVTGDTAVVRLAGALHRFDSSRHAAVIDAWLEGPNTLTTARSTKDAGDGDSQLESTCGVNERYDARCYLDSDPAAYDRSIPVALLITSTGEECTAWRVSSSNRMFTAEHCISGQSDLDGAEIWFQYRAESCGSSATMEPVKVTGGELLAQDHTLDYALFTVKDFESIAYLGHLGLDVREGARGEGIFIPQHGLGKPKQIAMESDMNTSGWCEIDDEDYDGYGSGTDIGYFCDTTTSSSGSPVLSSLTGKVIALHHLGGCFNSGSKIALIWPQVKAHFGNSVPQGDGDVPWGGGGNVNEPPDAHFKAYCTGLACSFDGSGSDDDDGAIDSWDWDFGDGAKATGVSVAHEFPEAGTYTVKLIVRDDAGATDAYSKPVTVTLPNAFPEAAFSTQCQYNACQFNGSGSSDADGSIVAWNWKFGDGATGSGTQVSHQYGAAGKYTITLTVKDDDGASDAHSYTATVSMPNQSPSASFTLNCANLTCSVDAAGSSDPDGSISAWQWAFGDGATANGAVATHTYPGPGNYTITLTVKDNLGASATTSKSANAASPEPEPKPEPKPDPEPDPDPNPAPTPDPDNQAPQAGFSTQCTDDRCTFDAGNSTDSDGKIVAYRWSFGDGHHGEGRTLLHAYEQAGQFQVTLTVEDDQGATDSAWGYVEVALPEPAPTAEFTVACSDRSCTLDAGSSTASAGAIASFDWAFGDGVTGTGQTVTHRYAEDGTYHVTLKVTGGNQTSDTRSRTIEVVSEPAIELSAASRRQNGGAVAVLTWTDAATDTVIIRRNGKPIAEVPNTGKYLDTDLASLRKSATYQVCDADGADCSEEIVVMLSPVWGLKAPQDKLPPAKVRR